MEMWLDKTKSATLALLSGLFVLAIGSAFALQFVARAHGVTMSRAADFAYVQPVRFWPFDMAVYLGVVVALAVAIMISLWTALRNHRWTFRPRRLDSAEAAADLIGKSAENVPRIFGGKFNGKLFYASIEDRGLVIGPPGTGKTTFLFNQVLRAMRAGLSFAVIDLKPELHKTLAPSLEKAGYRVLRINPAKVDRDADHWNPLADITDETDIAEMCAALLPIRDPREAPFVESQRDWLKAAVFHVSNTLGGSIPVAFNLLSSSSDPQKILDVLVRSENPTAARLARRIAAGLTGTKPDPLILQGLTGALRSLDYLGLSGVQDALGYSDFSARDLGKGEHPTALFLQFEEAKINALGPLLAFMATGVLTALMDTAGQRDPVALFLDELGNMPPIPNLPEKLNTIRSRHIPTWMYFQTAEQMNLRYGKGADEIFFASADMQMVFRLNDVGTRERIAKLVGTTEKYKYSANSTGQTRTREKVNVIEPHQLGQLKAGEVVALYRGAAARGRATPHYIDFPEFRRVSI
jgi:type IV secretory pathway TraG/TraD family ATPase VirD4